MKNFVEVNGSDHLNIIFNKLIENFEKMKLKNQKQNDIRSLFRSYIYFFVYPIYSYGIKKSSILIFVAFFCPKNQKLYI